MKLLIHITTSVLILLLMNSCFSQNYRKYMKDNIDAGGSIDFNGNAKYYNITIGSPSNPFDSAKMKFSIKLKNGMIFAADEMTLDKISSIPAIIKNTENNIGRFNEFGPTCVKFFIDGNSFVFLDNKIVCFSAAWIETKSVTYIPVIGNKNKTEFYEFPITQEQLESLFGKPDEYKNLSIN